MKRILPALFALVSAASASAATFQNGGFEIGTLTGDPCNVSLPISSTAITGWTVISGNIDYVTPACWPASEGTRSLDLVGSGSIGGIEQTFDTVPGQAYEVIFDLAGNPSGLFPPTVKNLTVTINGTPHSYTYNTLDHTAATIGWTAHSFTFVATGSSSTISFVSDMTGSSFAGAALDNVRVLAIPAGAWTGSGGTVYSGQTTSWPPVPAVVCSAPASWTVSGGGPFSYPLMFTAFGVQGPVVARYEVPFGNTAVGICGSWTTTHTATSTGTISVAWQYTDVVTNFTTADLQAFVIPISGPPVVQPLVRANLPPVNPPGNPGNQFLFSGQHSFNVQAGDTYGFTMTASNVDYIDALHGTLYLTGTGASSLGLQSSANPAPAGSLVTFTATVTGNNPRGTVAFNDGATAIAGCAEVALVPVNATQSTASCSVSSLAAGGHGINVFYSGDMTSLRSANMLGQTIDAAFVVDSTVDSVDASPGNGICADSIGRCTLRAAIMEANALAGAQTITLPAGTYALTIGGAGENGGTTGDLDIAGDVTIVGAGAASTIVDGGGLDRLFDVTSGIVTISDLTVRNGFTPAGQAGAGILNSGSLTLDQVAVSGNTTDADGGGIFNQGTLVLDSSTVSGNVGGGGAGIFSFGGLSTLDLTNSTISGNTSVATGQCGFGGGGMLIFNGGATITSSTIYANSAVCVPGAGGRGDAIASNGAAVTIQNSILASPITGGDACYGTVTSLGRNIVDDATCSPVASDLINTDPLLDPLADNGGPTPTHLPLFGSPVVDGVPNPNCTVALDQRGIARPQGAACDIGAVEGSQPALPVIATPVLVRALPDVSAVVPLLIGRVDGFPLNTPITVQLFSGTTCTNGVLGGSVAQVGADAPVTTDPLDPAGYFATLQGGTQGQFVAIRLSSPQVTPLSNCVVTAADNDTWPKALLLSGVTVTVPDWIDATGKARFYRFSVLPGQSIQVTLSGLPADYDLAVFKDIAREFANELVPATTDQLTKLSAQYAPSAFSPSAFSPSAFSPSAFSPSAFSPSAFSPSAFSPSAFSPSAFSPSAFSPSAFSPSAFSPSAFSPSAFSPSAFSPSAFSPSAFSPSAFSMTELVQAFSSAQTRSIIATSMTPGTGNESVVVNTWNNTGDFYVRVTGRAGAFSTSPYSLAVTKQGTSCAAVADTVISTRTPYANNGKNTIVLLDSSKTSLSAALPGGGTLGSKLAAFVLRPDVNGVIVDVALDSRVGTLKTQASNNVGCPFAKNLVAFEIKSIVDAYRATNPLQYVVIVGNDAAIPFFRYPDQTLLGQESGYVPPVSSNSASEASLRGNFVLSQDAYGAATHISLGVSELPIPGVAVGRLIETPAEIAGMIDAYVAANGSVSPASSLVTGYDFLQDAADGVRAELQSGTGQTPDTLITPNSVSPADTRSYASGGPWTAGDLRQKLLTTRHDVMFLAGHFNANSALAADFTSSLVTSELTASTVNLANALVFSAGCHAGYNLVDTDAINGVTFPLDWAQAFAQKKATLVAGTGYQYGDTEFLEYSERLYLNFAKELRAGTGNVFIGEALVKAKLAYLAATPDVRGLHAKAVLEATLFGLPMLGVNMPTGRTVIPTNNGVVNALAPAVPTPAATALGLRLADLPVSSTTLTPHTLTLTNYDDLTTTTATWLSGPDGVVTNPAEPALPLQVVNVTPTNPALVLRGVGFRGASYSESAVFPLTGAPTTELRGVHTPFSSPVFFPMRLWTSNYFSALSGGNGTNLLVTPAQHRALNAADSTLRQYSGLALRLFYSDSTALSDPDNAAAFLSDAPTIVRVDAVPSGAVTTFSAQVVGDPAAAIHEVWVTYTNGAGGSGTWTSVNLQQCVTPLPAACGTTSDSQFWKGAVATAALPTDTKYIVQAASGTGLVSLDDNLGRYYAYSVAATAPAATTIAFGPPVPTGAAFGQSLAITAVLSAGASPVAGKVVTIAAGGGARTGTTNAAGSVTVQLPMLSPPDTLAYPLSASFGGDAAYLPSSVSIPSAITVTKVAPTLAPPTSGVGAVLTGGPQPLVQESIQFLISGPQGVQQVFAITDYIGRATIPPPGLPVGTYSVIQACFAGNATYTNAKLNANPACGYTFGGFAQPVDNLPTVNSAKAGSAIPVKFGLGGNYGLTLFDVGSPKSQAIACGTSPVVDTIEETVTAGGSGLSYDSASGRYNYVWKTDKAWAGTCRQLILNFNDGTTQRASFKFTK